MEKENSSFNIKKIILFSSILLFFDQITKFFFTGKTILSDFFIYIKYSENTGSAFSIFSNTQNYDIINILLSIIVLGILIKNIDFFLKNKYYFYTIILLFAGILGNLMDRIIFGYVRDFIALEYFFIFNIADAYLSISLILFFLYEYVEYSQLKELENKVKNKIKK